MINGRINGRRCESKEEASQILRREGEFSKNFLFEF